MPPLDQARALLSSPVTACCGAVTSIMARFRSEPVVNFAHIQIENGLSAGVGGIVPRFQAGATSDAMGTSSA
jgi:hypothetical protein